MPLRCLVDDPKQNQPRRVWRRRGRGAKGWRKPDNTVSVCRPANYKTTGDIKWGNPFLWKEEGQKLTKTEELANKAKAVELFR